MLTLPNPKAHIESPARTTPRLRDPKVQGVLPRSPRATLKFCPPNARPRFPPQSAKSTLNVDYKATNAGALD
jgi:hypothetical protein